MLGEVRVYGPTGKLKRTISTKTLIKMRDKEIYSLKTDVNLNGKKSSYVKKKTPVRHLTCHNCEGKITTTIRRKKYYCGSSCGEMYREKIKKSGGTHVKHSMEEIVWVPSGKKVRRNSGTSKSKRGEN
jgi:hypothetical protein